MTTEKKIIEFALDEIEDYEWLFYPTKDEDDDEIISDDNIQEAAKALKASPELVKAIREAFRFLASEIVVRTKEDIKDLWNKF